MNSKELGFIVADFLHTTAPNILNSVFNRQGSKLNDINVADGDVIYFYNLPEGILEVTIKTIQATTIAAFYFKIVKNDVVCIVDAPICDTAKRMPTLTQLTLSFTRGVSEVREKLKNIIHDFIDAAAVAEEIKETSEWTEAIKIWLIENVGISNINNRSSKEEVKLPFYKLEELALKASTIAVIKTRKKT